MGGRTRSSCQKSGTSSGAWWMVERASRSARSGSEGPPAARCASDWLVMGDDDTIFPDNLVAALCKYKHEENVM